MKLAFSTLGCPDWGFEKVLKNAKEMGYQGIELRGVDGEMLAAKTERFSPARMEETKKLIEDSGIHICGFNTSVKFDRPENYDGFMQEGLGSIDVCERMGFPAIRVFGDTIPPGQREEEVIGRISGGYRKLCAYARDKGIEVYQEVHGEFNTIERIRAICDRLPDENYGLIWDIGHTDRAYGDDFMPFYEAVKPWIRHVHIKDAQRRQGEAAAHCLPGEGDIPIKKIVQTLLDDGYDGYFSFEWEKKWALHIQEPEIAFPAYVAYMKAL